jgi:Na+-translocating ferredoxin:NAD+ oxidoreductase subunit D
MIKKPFLGLLKPRLEYDIGTHAPFWHDRSSLSAKHFHIMLAATLAIIPGFVQYGGCAVAVVCFSVSTAMIWEMIFNKIKKQPVTIGDGNAALIGLLLAMMVPATTPWWAVLSETFLAIVIGKQILRGLGGNPFNPVVISMVILSFSWKEIFDFNETLLSYDFHFTMAYPLASLKAFGPDSISSFSTTDLLMGRQTGGIGSTCGIALLIGGLYLIVRGFIRWEISFSFLAGVFVTALLFTLFGEEGKYAGPLFHLFTGYTLIGAFYLATENASSPATFIPMLLYGAGCGILTIVIRNIDLYVDGVILSLFLMNLANLLFHKIRPKAVGGA